jgi:hypothetical protein
VYRTTETLRSRDARSRDAVLDAVRFSVSVALGGFVCLGVATAWVGTCGGSTFDTVACGAPQLTLLTLGAPLILIAGGLWAFFRTYKLRRQHGIWWPWHTAGWILVAAMLLVLATSVPSIALP